MNGLLKFKAPYMYIQYARVKQILLKQLTRIEYNRIE